MARDLHRRVDRLEARREAEGDPSDEWAIFREHAAAIDANPHARLVCVLAGVPVPLLEAVHALDADPRLPAIRAHAERQAPKLAAGADEFDAALDARDRGEPLTLPCPAEAIGAARQHLFHNPADHVTVPYGRVNRRHTAGLPPVTYDLSSVEGAAVALIDHWAYTMWNLDRTGSNFLSDHRVDDGLAWWAAQEPRP